jgi:GPH family glycoside/pentoside/hexuronide:cation symporter
MTNSSDSKNFNVKLSMREKVSYGLGDTACNIIFSLITTYLILFYTDYAGISPAVIGMVVLVSRIFDGGSDILMGVITEKTKSKYGKARPWVLWMAVPFAVSGVALFLVPAGATELVKVIYVFVTYNLATTVVYTAINLPYGALAAMMTRDQNERAVTNVMRMVLAFLGRILATSFTLPFVELLGGTQRSWVIVSAVFCVIAMILLFICFANTKERVQIEAAREKKVSAKEGLLALIHNVYWLKSLSLWGILSIYATVNGMALPYYCKYILGNQNYTGTIFAVEQACVILGIVILPMLIPRFGKRNLALFGSIVAIAGQFLLMLDTQSYQFAVVSSAVKGLGQAPLFGVIFSFIADAVEYGQWKTHVRQEGMIFSAASVGSKVGAGLSSAVVGGILAMSGYIASDGSEGIVHQPQDALSAISSIFVWGAVIIWGAAVAILYFYKLDKIYPSMMRELEAREAKGEL